MLALALLAQAFAQQDERGASVFAEKCAGCHGPMARGLTEDTDLMRSTAVRTDHIGPVLSAGHPKANPVRLSNTEQSDVAVWLHAQVQAVADRGTYPFLNILTGDPRQGQAFFQETCARCHSVTGDLAGMGEKYDPSVLQSLWLSPRRRRGAEAVKTARTVTVTPHSGPAVSGTLERMDEFNLVLRDKDGNDRSFALNEDDPKVEIHDPLQPHYDLYRRLTDQQIHDMTAYLASLK